MVLVKQAPSGTHIDDILLKCEAALNALHQYHKFGRHTGRFPEKAYFLLSHCAQLLFSLWLTESESPTSTFEYSSLLRILTCNLDFEALRPIDDGGRVLHTDAYQECLKNDLKWFDFWLKALEMQDETKPLNCQKFSQDFRKYVNQPGFLEGRIAKRSRKALSGLMKTDTVAQIFCRSMLILEEVIAGVVFRLMNLGESTHATEQLALLICMLCQVRRTIVIESPAQGPYVLLSNKNWGVPSILFWLYGRRKRGTLKIVLKRDGGGIVCSYSSAPDSQLKRRSWTRNTSALRAPYEEELFKTWSYDTGEHLGGREPSTDPKAHWTVQRIESKRLQILFWHIEAVVKTLATNPLCSGLTANIGSVWIDNQTNGQGTRITWTYIKKLDHLLDKLELTYREARVLAGKKPGEEVIAGMWPPIPSVCEPAEQSRSHELDVTAPSQESSSPNELPRPKPTELAKETPIEAQSPQSSVAETEQTLPTELTRADSCGSTGATNPHEQMSPSIPQPPLTSQVTGDLADETGGGQGTDQVNCIEEVEAVANNLANKETEEKQESLEEFSDEEQEQYSSTPLSEGPISDSLEKEQEQQPVAECPTEGIYLESRPQEPCRQMLDLTGPDAKALVYSETQIRANQVNPMEENEEVAGNLNEEATEEQEPFGQFHTGSQEADRIVSEWHLQCDQARDKPQEHNLESVAEEDQERAAPISGLSGQEEDRTFDVTSLTSESRPEASSLLLRQQLLGWHAPAHGAVNYEPLSRRQLQQDLGWTQSEVQYVMTKLFGPRPFTVYREKCKSRTVCDLLEDDGRPWDLPVLAHGVPTHTQGLRLREAQ